MPQVGFGAGGGGIGSMNYRPHGREWRCSLSLPAHVSHPGWVLPSITLSLFPLEA